MSLPKHGNSDKIQYFANKLSNEYDPHLAKKIASLSPVATAFDGWHAANESLLELRQLIKDSTTDEELSSLATEEIEAEIQEEERLSKDLQSKLVPEHPFASLPCLVEIRPGAGGDEAALFAGDLLRMYQAYCKRNGLRANLIKLESAASNSAEDQIQEAVLEIESPSSYDILRCEAGVHRVQRVPATESKGRTHTSAVSVLVLPNFPAQGDNELDEHNLDDPSNDYYVDPKDVRTDVMRARGAGGQHVNTTDSAVRLTHIPTNTVVAIQDARSQHKNRAKAWQILRAKLAQARREAREEEMAQLRVSVVGVAKMGRGDKIRTYNWSQQRVTDHRSGITVHNLDDVLKGGDNLSKIMASVKDWLTTKDVEALIADEEAAKLQRG
ncbi:Peptide chain release factor 1, mitochondrial [Lecanora helva]